MGESVEYRDGVFVAAAATAEPADAGNLPAAATGTALIVRPGEDLVQPGTQELAATTNSLPIPPFNTTDDLTQTRTPGIGRRVAVATVIASLIAAVAIGAAAFGGAFGSGNPSFGKGSASLGAAAANSAAATSVDFTLSATGTSNSSTTTFVAGTGAVDLKTDVGRLSATIPSLSGLLGSNKDTVNVVSDGTSAYIGAAALSSLTGGDQWVKVPLSDSQASSSSSTLAVLGDPSQLLSLLTSLGGHVTTVGNVDLNGTPTTEYSTAVTVAEFAKRAGLPTGTASGQRLSKILAQLGSTSVPIRAWVGTDGYVRQLSVSLDLSKVTLGGVLGDVVSGSLGGTTSDQSTSATTVTVGFSNYGAPVNVTVPPASQTVDLGSMLSSLHGLLSGIGNGLSAYIASR